MCSIFENEKNENERKGAEEEREGRKKGGREVEASALIQSLSSTPLEPGTESEGSISSGPLRNTVTVLSFPNPAA